VIILLYIVDEYDSKLSVIALTVIIGLWNSREVVKRSPLEILMNV